jgi:ferrochelatase
MKHINRAAVLLINLGSPISPELPDVKAFLKAFLGDSCVLTMPAVLRHCLVNGIIAPIRAPRSTRMYRQLWDERGSPFIYHGENLLEALNATEIPGHDIYLAMRYGKHSMAEVLPEVEEKGYRKLLIIPLFPHYAGSTVGSIMEEARKSLRGKTLYNRTRVLLQFHEWSDFMRLWIRRIQPFLSDGTDALVLSYHGIPVSHPAGSHGGTSCRDLRCMERYSEANCHCYNAACHESTRQISAGLDFSGENIHMAYQSRFGRKWLGPQTKDVLTELARSGCRNVVVACPSFVADCLETIVEIGYEYRKLFLKEGGESLQLVPSLNSDTDWVEFLCLLIKDHGHEALPLDRVQCRGARLFMTVPEFKK